MDSLQHLKSRLKAVKNISQITKAMEVVAATKMRRAQEVALSSRPFALRALEILEKVTRRNPVRMPLTAVRPIKKTLLVVVASDRGLAGSFNTQVFRAADYFLAADTYEGHPEHLFTLVGVGKKAAIYASKKKLEVVRSFQKFGDFVRPEEIEPLAGLVVEGFEAGTWDRVITISTHFRTTLRQETLIRQVLPVDFEKIRETVRGILPEHGRYAGSGDALARRGAEETEYIFEPSPEEAVNFLIPQLIKMQMYHLILEANASEHSARRVAMKNATDNAEELGGKLILDYNKVRQASITKELIEITSTQNALT